jgi:hypothetical protein
MSAPIVNGVPILSCEPVPWEFTDDVLTGWAIVGRALVTFPQGGLANGLLVVNSRGDKRCIIWERPPEGGRGRFRAVPLGAWP